MRNAAAKANYRLQFLVGASKATMLDDFSKIDESLTQVIEWSMCRLALFVW
jgi:hypothetical protein